MRFIFFALLFITSHLCASSLEEVPIAYSGRYVPLETYAQELLAPFAQSSVDFFLDLHLHGNKKWEDEPLIKVTDSELKKALSLPSKGVWFSYKELLHSLSPNILYHLIIHHTKEEGKSELSSLAPGIRVKKRNETIQILQLPNTFPWNTLKVGTLNTPLSSLSSFESLETLLKHLNLFSAFNHPELFSLALPSKLDKEKWLPLSALTSFDTNFTHYSDQQFHSIQKAYYDLSSEINKTHKQVLAAALTTAYQSLEGEFPSTWQLKAERIYSKCHLSLLSCFSYLGAILLGFPALLIAFALHTADLALRIYILERPPVSNMAETLLYVPWITVAIAFILFKKEKLLLSIAALIAAVLLALSYYMNPQLENVQPVLNSQLWLTVHVLMVVASYGAFILAGTLGHTYLITQNPSITRYTSGALYLGTFLLITGTILGGVWATQSWGRFWDWDPKESWAFISSCTYLIIIHLYRFRIIGAWGLHVGAIVGMVSITFTWYGVNYILGTGFHSYGFGSGGVFYYYLYLIAELLFLVWYNYAPLRQKKS